MCTVTYVPRKAGGFFLTSNRDEAPQRAANGVERVQLQEVQVLFPKDKGAGGTWIAGNSVGSVLCLLNGAFERHERIPPYRKSRGLMLLELIEEKNIPEAFNAYLLDNMEPFTLILATPSMLWEFRWDGTTRFIRSCNPLESHIWSSATLYPAPVRQERVAWFRAWEEGTPEVDLKKMLTFHRSAGKGDSANDVVMNRDGIVQTVSITCIAYQGPVLDMWFFDLLTEQNEYAQLILNQHDRESDSAAAFLD